MTAHPHNILRRSWRPPRPFDRRPDRRGLELLARSATARHPLPSEPSAHPEDPASEAGRGTPLGRQLRLRTGPVLRGLGDIRRGLLQDYIQRAIAWLEVRQTRRRLGETSPPTRTRIWRGAANPLPSQTAWALLACSRRSRGRPAVEKGVRFLIDRQGAEGTWEDRSGTVRASRGSSTSVSPLREILPALHWRLSERER